LEDVESVARRRLRPTDKFWQIFCMVDFQVTVWRIFLSGKDREILKDILGDY
jgi:hypothetical protein